MHNSQAAGSPPPANFVSSLAYPRPQKLGQILVERGILTSLTVDRALPICRRHQMRFGELLMELGFLTEEELAEALALQHGHRTIARFSHHRFPPDVLRLITVETAMEHVVFPLKLSGQNLALAMMDPTNNRLINNLQANLRIKVVPVVACRQHIIEAIARHYLGREIDRSSRPSILIVDDQVGFRNSLAMLLKLKGYSVRTADNGIDAFKEVITNKPALVITDKEMPKLNGYGLLDALRNVPETRKIPVILITGNNSPAEEASAYERGFSEFLGKPFEEAVLLAKVKRAMGKEGLL